MSVLLNYRIYATAQQQWQNSVVEPQKHERVAQYPEKMFNCLRSGYPEPTKVHRDHTLSVCAWFVGLYVNSLRLSVHPYLFSELLDSNVKVTKQSSEWRVYTWVPPHLWDLLAFCTIQGFVVYVCIAMLSQAAYFSKCAQFNPHKYPLNYSSISSHSHITFYSFAKCGRRNADSLVCIVDFKLYNRVEWDSTV